MVRPLVILYPIFKNCIVVSSRTDVYYQVVVVMRLFQVACNIFNRIPICFFDEIRGWESHSDDFVSYIGEVELLSLIAGSAFGPSNHFFDEIKHQID